ncbi:SHOCT domain-containing protein [Tepidibacillus infernus]|uniref:SHOCT domain-containing protein n=1 Tax=Tepidibacillus decaturensis TaxID=1413211 RepID=A0A135L1U2_9BACI|nr:MULTISPECIES: SHOCT domain-containing protein [Tepidibacillus]KXG42926.1 hypothetical protein U473_01950 [Tepidibacillus decaturensis]GBF10931.1 hypothetical protein HK1_00947 [Tepidibacillus sp. HK-1]
MLNLILTIIVAYYLIKTGDLFKLLRKAQKFVTEFFTSIKQETQSSKKTEDPVEILKVRFAKGEISQSEFEKMKESF